MEQQRRPQLSLVKVGEPSWTRGSPRDTMHFELGLVNSGHAPALDWHVTIRAPSGSTIHQHPRQGPGERKNGQLYTQDSDGSWRCEWWALSDADVVSPGAERPAHLSQIEATYPTGQEFVCSWTITARGMKDRKGRLLTGTNRVIAIVPG